MHYWNCWNPMSTHSQCSAASTLNNKAHQDIPRESWLLFSPCSLSTSFVLGIYICRVKYWCAIGRTDRFSRIWMIFNLEKWVVCENNSDYGKKSHLKDFLWSDKNLTRFFRSLNAVLKTQQACIRSCIHNLWRAAI